MRHLPSKAAEDEKRKEMELMFNTAARAGAGGTKAGLPGLRPMGKKGIDFLDSLTPKRKKQKSWRDEVLPEHGEHEKRRDVDAKAKIILPRNWCPDCSEVKSKPGVCININQFPQGRPEWGLGPKDLLISFFCDACFQAQASGKHDKADDIYLAKAGVNGARTNGEYNAANRLVRIKQNTEDYMRAHCHDEEIRVRD